MTQPTQQPAQPVQQSAPVRAIALPTLAIPVSTIIVIIIALVGGVELVVNGHLSDDFAKYAATVGGSTGLLAIGRGLDSQSKP